MGNIVSTLTKGRKADPGNYWPVGVTSDLLCAWEDNGTDAPRSCAKTRGDREVIQDSRHSVTKGKSCQTSLVAFYDGMIASGDKERATDVLYLDIHKAFDTIFHPSLQIGEVWIWWGECSVDKKLVGWTHPEKSNQQFSV